MAHHSFSIREHAEVAAAQLPAMHMRAEKAAMHAVHGVHDKRKSGGHEKFWQYREYADSDRPQDIDWRQSAKGDHIYVREKEYQTPQSFYFWCARHAGMNFQSSSALYSKLQAAQILSLGLAILVQRSNEQIGFLGMKRVGHSTAMIDLIGQRLQEDDKAALPEGIIPAHSMPVLCGDFLSPMDAIADSLAAYQERCAHLTLIQVLDPAEIALPYSGHVVFEGLGGEQHSIDNVGAVRDAYRERMRRHLQSVQDLCTEHGWTYCFHRTDTAPSDTLFDIWQMLEVGQ